MKNTTKYKVTGKLGANVGTPTNWNIGAIIVRVSSFDKDGYAGFSTPQGGCVIHAHKSEVEEIVK